MISGQELKEFLWEKGVMPMNGMLIADSKFSLPDFDWMVQKFGPSYESILRQMGISEWTEEMWDCDNFAQLASAYASIVHRVVGRKKTGLAMGEFWFEQRSGGGHAINAAVVMSKGKKLDLRFWEPQTRQELKLTKGEIESCSGARF